MRIVGTRFQAGPQCHVGYSVVPVEAGLAPPNASIVLGSKGRQEGRQLSALCLPRNITPDDPKSGRAPSLPPPGSVFSLKPARLLDTMVIGVIEIETDDQLPKRPCVLSSCTWRLQGPPPYLP